jgi:hypothetical protein
VLGWAVKRWAAGCAQGGARAAQQRWCQCRIDGALPGREALLLSECCVSCCWVGGRLQRHLKRGGLHQWKAVPLLLIVAGLPAETVRVAAAAASGVAAWPAK